MAKVITPRYAVHVEVEPATRALTPFAWSCPVSGRPTVQNLVNWMARYNLSFAPGGVNEHVGPLRIVAARIVRNEAGGATVAEVRQ